MTSLCFQAAEQIALSLQVRQWKLLQYPRVRKAVSKDACKLCRWGSRRLLGLSFITFSWYISKLFVFAFSSWWGVFLKSFPLTAVNRALSGYLSHFQPQWNHSHFIAICCCVKQAAEVSSSSTSSSLVFNAGTLLPAAVPSLRCTHLSELSPSSQ